MVPKGSQLAKLFAANLALVRPLVEVRETVSFEGVRSGQPPGAEWAREWPLPGVTAHVTLQVLLDDELAGAEVARELPDVVVPHKVPVQARAVGERVGTQVAPERPLSCVHAAYVDLQRVVQAERLGAVRAFHRPEPFVHQLVVSVQAGLARQHLGARRTLPGLGSAIAQRRLGGLLVVLGAWRCLCQLLAGSAFGRVRGRCAVVVVVVLWRVPGHSSNALRLGSTWAVVGFRDACRGDTCFCFVEGAPVKMFRSLRRFCAVGNVVTGEASLVLHGFAMDGIRSRRR